jgi:hypothetical protein
MNTEKKIAPRPTARVTPERDAVCALCETEVYSDGAGMLRHTDSRSPFCDSILRAQP